MRNFTTNHKTGKLSLLAGIVALTLSATTSRAQLNVGSNTAPNTGAMLEVSGNTKGILFSRVSLTNTTTWGLDGTQTAGMTIYNTNTGITSTNDTYPKHPDGKGVYYWDGTGWVAGGAGNFSTTPATQSNLIFVSTAVPVNGSSTFYTETDDNDAPIADPALQSQTANLYIGSDGSSWIWNGTAYITKVLPKPGDHDWYTAKTTAAPTNINLSAYALGFRGIGINAPAYQLDVRRNKAAGTTPVANAMVGNFQNNAGNIALRMGNSAGRFYLGRTVNAYGSLPANSIFIGQHVLSSSAAKIVFGDGFGTTTPSVDMLIDAGTGNVGIGVTDPTAKLDVAGTATGTNSLLLRSGNSNAGSPSSQILFGFNGTNLYQHAIKTRHNSLAPGTNSIDFYTWNQGVDAGGDVGTKQVMTIDGTGNVGVGVGMTVPSDRVTVTGGSVNVTDDDAGLKLGQLNTGVFRSFNEFGSTSYDMVVRAQGGILFAADANTNSSGTALDDDGSFIFGKRASNFTTPGFTETMRLTNLGHLKFPNDEKNRKIVLWQTTDNDHQFYGFGINSLELRYQTAANAADHVFYSANTATTSDELMRIKGNGRVGIGTSTPTAMLNVAGEIEAYGGSSRTGQFYEGNSSKPGGQLFASATDGYLAVQRQGSNAQAAWAGYFTRSSYFAGTTGFLSFVINGSQLGQIFANTNSSVFYATTSDVRLKENIRTSGLGLADVMKIDVRDYNYKKDSTKALQTGFIAQQLYTVFPQAVYVGGEDVDKSPWQVDYSKLTPLLTKAIQEQQVQIAALTKTNEMLTAQVTDLQEKEAAYAALSERVKQMEQMIGINTPLKAKPSIGVITKKKKN